MAIRSQCQKNRVVFAISRTLLISYGLLGIYYVLANLLYGTDYQSFAPDFDFLRGFVGLYSMILGLPLAAITAFVQKKILYSFLGIVFVVFFVIGIYLLNEAFV